MNPSDLARYVGAAPTWLAQYLAFGGKNNPAANDILADTGAMAAGYYDVFWNCASTAAVTDYTLIFSWRDAANTGDFWNQCFCSAGAITMNGFLLGVKVGANERFKLWFPQALTGVIRGGIVAVRRA
jgi:hypothetical protein